MTLKNESANKKRLPGKRSAGRAAKLRGKKWRLFNGVKHGVSVNSFKPILKAVDKGGAWGGLSPPKISLERKY